jgi:hypothetical protein
MTEEHVDKLRAVATKSSITILPIWAEPKDAPTHNLYPVTNQVETWNIFVVGSDKSYILAQVHEPLTNVPNHNALLNRRADNIIPPDMQEFFDSVWDNTLQNVSLQLFVAWNNRLFRVNTFPLVNELKTVVGATMFMRSFNPTNYDSNSTTLSKLVTNHVAHVTSGHQGTPQSPSAPSTPCTPSTPSKKQ